MEWADGSLFEGEWVNNKRSGKGVLKTKTEEYEGEWLNDAKHGTGKAKTFEEGIEVSTYEGEW